MNESLIQQYYVNDDGWFLELGLSRIRTFSGCKILSLKMIVTLFKEVLVPANLVPAAAVIREGQALSEITGRKESVDCNISYMLKFKA